MKKIKRLLVSIFSFALALTGSLIASSTIENVNVEAASLARPNTDDWHSNTTIDFDDYDVDFYVDYNSESTTSIKFLLDLNANTNCTASYYVNDNSTETIAITDITTAVAPINTKAKYTVEIKWDSELYSRYVFAVVEREKVALPPTSGWHVIPKDSNNNRVDFNTNNIACYDYYKPYVKNTSTYVFNGLTTYDDNDKFTVTIDGNVVATPSTYALTDPKKVAVEVKINDISKYKWDNTSFYDSPNLTYNASNGLIGYTLSNDYYHAKDAGGNYIDDTYYCVGSTSGFVDESENFDRYFEVYIDNQWCEWGSSTFIVSNNSTTGEYRVKLKQKNENYVFSGTNDYKEGKAKYVYLTVYSPAEYEFGDSVISKAPYNFIDFEQGKTYDFIKDSQAFTKTYYKKDAKEDYQTYSNAKIGEVGSYKVTLTLNDGYCWKDGSFNSIDLFVDVATRTVVNYPTIDTTQFEYSNYIRFDAKSHQIFSNVDFDNLIVTIEIDSSNQETTITSLTDPNLSATHTHKYLVRFYIKDWRSAKWSDGKVDMYFYSFEILPKYLIGQLDYGGWHKSDITPDGDSIVMEYEDTWIEPGSVFPKLYLELFDSNNQYVLNNIPMCDVSMEFNGKAAEITDKATEIGTYTFKFNNFNSLYQKDLLFFAETETKSGFDTYTATFTYKVLEYEQKTEYEYSYQYNFRPFKADSFSMNYYLTSTIYDKTGTNELPYIIDVGDYKIKYQLNPKYVGKVIYHYLDEVTLDDADDYFFLDAHITKKLVYIDEKIISEKDNYELTASGDDFIYELEYDGKYHYLINLLYSDKNVFDVKYYSYDSLGYTTLYSKAKVIDAGKYRAIITLKDNAHYAWNTITMSSFDKGYLVPIYSDTEKTNLIGYGADFIINPYKILFIPSIEDEYEYNGKVIDIDIKADYSLNIAVAYTYKVYKAETFESIDNPGTETELKNVGEYKLVTDPITGNMIFPSYVYHIYVYTNYIDFNVSALDIQYGIKFDELQEQANVTLSKSDLSESLKEEVLNNEWALSKECGPQPKKNVYTKDNFNTIVPGSYYVLLRTKDEQGEYTNTYDNSYVCPLYSLNCSSQIVINKKVCNIEWSADDFTYNKTNRFNEVKACYYDGNNSKVELVVTNDVANDFTFIDEYLFYARFDETLNTISFNQDTYYVLIGAQKNYTMHKGVIDWDNVKFDDYKIEYKEFLADTDKKYENDIVITGLPEEVTVSYDLSNIRTYKGIYEISVSLSSDVYEIPVDKKKITARFVVGVKKETVKKLDDDIVIIETVDEKDILDPTLRLVVIKEVEDTHDTFKKEIKKEVKTSWTEQVMSVYDVKLLDENNVVTQPDGKLMIALKVPEKILNGDFRIFHRHEDEAGNVTITEVSVQKIVDGYAYFEVDKLSEFVFTYKYTSLIWLIILLSVLILGLLGLLALQVLRIIKKRNNFKKSVVSTLAVAPVFYMDGHLEAVITLAIICGVLLLLNIAAFIFYKLAFNPIKEKKVKKELVKEEKKEEVVEEKPQVEEESITLKESMEKLENVVTDKTISKKTIAEYLGNELKQVTVNCRANYTAPSKGNKEGLPLADTHYVNFENKKECFIYVYENKSNAVLILIKLNDKDANKLKGKHKSISISRFPKVSHGLKYYSLPIDDTYAFNDVTEIIKLSINSVSSYKESN